MLHAVAERVADAERLLAEGTDRQKVQAAGDLSFLKLQRQALAERLAQLIAASTDASETPWRWLQEEVFNLKYRLECWIGQDTTRPN